MMSLRTLIRAGVLALGLLLFSPLLWRVAGPWPLLAGPGVLAATLVYLLLASGARRTTRWQIRYQMATRQANDRLEATLSYLAERAGLITLQADSQGLFLEAPVAFDRYIQIQMERALPQARVSRANNNSGPHLAGSTYLSLDPFAGDPLRWATEAPGRRVRLHLHRGPYTTVVARTADGAWPPGRWVCLPRRGVLAARLWSRLPIWDELSAGIHPSCLLPTTEGGAVYASRSRLLDLSLPHGYSGEGNRPLGVAVGGQPLALSSSVPLFTVGAPADFLVQQAVEDVARGQSVVVVSPHRPILSSIQRRAEAPTYWLDAGNARASAHLAVVAAAEWAGQPSRVETAIERTQAFLGDLGLDLHLPTTRTWVGHLVCILAASAQATGHDFAFTDLYAISQSVQTLKAFLADLQTLGDSLDPEARRSVEHLSAQLGQHTGYLQIVTVLSGLRSVLAPLRTGALHTLCQPPFFDVGRALRTPSLVLVPATNAELPEYDHFLVAMLDLALGQALAGRADDLRLALHLHDPQRYYGDGVRRRIETARQDGRVSLLVDVGDPGDYLQVLPTEGEEGEVVFRSCEALASTLVADWDLPYTVAEVAELPDGTALARLPGLPGPVALRSGAEPSEAR